MSNPTGYRLVLFDSGDYASSQTKLVGFQQLELEHPSDFGVYPTRTDSTNANFSLSFVDKDTAFPKGKMKLKRTRIMNAPDLCTLAADRAAPALPSRRTSGWCS